MDQTITFHCSAGIQHGLGAGGQRAAEDLGEPELKRGDAEADAEHVRQERREGRAESEGDGRAAQEARQVSQKFYRTLLFHFAFMLSNFAAENIF